MFHVEHHHKLICPELFMKGRCVGVEKAHPRQSLWPGQFMKSRSKDEGIACRNTISQGMARAVQPQRYVDRAGSRRRVSLGK